MSSELRRDPPATPSRGRAAEGAETRTTLIEVAERLYAERGIDGVSLREIAGAAGQHNPAVVQYHFGSRDGLLRAIIDYRAARIDQQRSEMLDAAVRAGGCADAVPIIAAIVEPLAEEVRRESHYVGMMTRLTADDRARRPPASQRTTKFASVARAAALLRTLRPDLPEAVFAVRFWMVFDVTMSTLADFQGRARAGIPDDLDLDSLCADLVTTTAAIVMAPAR